ncbi:Ankyrin repeat and fibronectin type-III domain containing protein 1 [Dissostichus eleginoides]|uniref:Ankyrin repeat and fibronectin type-III domain containing protein 1 n=1 Tax=Dissostichus eleginoides TaxID=100907 RepID=A0AAD9B1S3_DISEL|nr:Ankyrin repeat and fibronectin type-III domain containing protein 1 [Dissostichus eleginoides]
MPVSKLQSQRKSLSTPEEPYGPRILIITIQDIMAYQRRGALRLTPGLYLGFLKLSSSVDQIRVLVSQRHPNCSATHESETTTWMSKSPAPLLYYELQTSIKALYNTHLNLPLRQSRLLRLYSQEVVELGHGVSFLLLLPAADDIPVPLDQIPVPLDQIPVPLVQIPVPLDQIPVPLDQIPVPLDQIPVPLDQIPVPLVQIPVPFDQIPVPLDQIPVPLDQIPVPVD